MRKQQPLVTTRTPEPPRGELPLSAPAVPPPPSIPERRPADKIKEALLRWLEEEM
jgi:hypothetical protein